MANFQKGKKYHFTYKTTNLINKRYYLGMHSTNNINDNYLGSGKRLWYEIRKYGKENFKIEILNYYNTREELIEAEKNLITENDLNNNNCLNLKLGGSGGFTLENAKKGRIATDKILKEKYGENFRKIVSSKLYINETKEQKYKRIEKIKRRLKEVNFNHATFKGKKHKEETKRKIGLSNSIKQKGEKNSQYGTCWITNGKEIKKIKKEQIYMYPEWKLGRK